MLTGVFAARNTCGAEYDVWSVNVDKEYHEEGEVVEAAATGRAAPTRVTVPEPVTELSPEEVVEVAFAKLDPIALGLACGLVAGLGLFVSSVVLLLKGGDVVGPNLSLLSHYFLGFKVTWGGAILGLMEMSVGGYMLGYLGATLRNLGISAYAGLLRRRAEAEQRRDLLDKL